MNSYGLSRTVPILSLIIILGMAVGIGYLALKPNSTFTSLTSRTVTTTLPVIHSLTILQPTSLTTTQTLTTTQSIDTTQSIALTQSSTPTVTKTELHNVTIVVIQTANSFSGGTNVSDSLFPFNLFLHDLSNGNTSDLANFYNNFSVVNWTGEASGRNGVYAGQRNIQLLYGSTIGHCKSLALDVNRIEAISSGANQITISSTLIMKGNNQIVGNFSALIVIKQIWGSQAGNWVIQNDLWDFYSFSVQNQGQAW